MIINNFDGEYFFLSNFSRTSKRFHFAGNMWDCSEHAYQAMKATNQDDFLLVANSETPGIAKGNGRKIKIHPMFDYYKVETMWTILVAKFSLPREKELLLSTGDSKLVEGNYWHDNFWGSCTCGKCKNLDKFNRLGLLLEELRDILGE